MSTPRSVRLNSSPPSSSGPPCQPRSHLYLQGIEALGDVFGDFRGALPVGEGFRVENAEDGRLFHHLHGHVTPELADQGLDGARLLDQFTQIVARHLGALEAFEDTAFLDGGGEQGSPRAPGRP